MPWTLWVLAAAVLSVVAWLTFEHLAADQPLVDAPPRLSVSETAGVGDTCTENGMSGGAMVISGASAPVGLPWALRVS